MIAHNKERNKLTERFLQLCLLLVEFGYYQTPTVIRELLAGLYDLLDTKSDMAVQDQAPEDTELWQNGPRYAKTGDNKYMYLAKLAGAQIVDMILNYVFSHSLGRFLAQFKLVRGRGRRRRRAYARTRGGHSSCGRFTPGSVGCRQTADGTAAVRVPHSPNTDHARRPAGRVCSRRSSGRGLHARPDGP